MRPGAPASPGSPLSPGSPESPWYPAEAHMYNWESNVPWLSSRLALLYGKRQIDHLSLWPLTALLFDLLVLVDQSAHGIPYKKWSENKMRKQKRVKGKNKHRWLSLTGNPTSPWGPGSPTSPRFPNSPVIPASPCFPAGPWGPGGACTMAHSHWPWSP